MVAQREIIPSASRTVTFVSDEIQSNFGNWLQIIFEVETIPGAAPDLKLRIQPRTIGLTYFQLNPDPDSLTTTGHFLYVVGPASSSPGINPALIQQIVKLPAPIVWRLEIVHGNANPVTYRADYQLNA